MTAPTSADNASGTHLRPEIQQIISSGQRVRPVRTGSLLTVVALSAASLLLLWASFTPAEFAPAAWLALVPLLQLTRCNSLPRRSYRVLTVLSILWAAGMLQWMRLGHVMMYAGLAGMALYLGLYVPVFLAVVRRIRRACPQVPLWLAVPVVWTALEFARAYLLTGFSWYYLGHSQYRWQALIQISDVTGAYGVSFLVAMSSGVLAEMVPLSLLQRWNLDVGRTHDARSVTSMAAGPIVLVALLAGCLVYGASRYLGPDQFTEGPAIALIQGNFSPTAKHDESTILEREGIHMLLQHHAATLQPVLIVWPETMFPYPLTSVEEGVTDQDILDSIAQAQPVGENIDAEAIINYWRSDILRRNLADMTQALGCATVIGAETHIVGRNRITKFNSALFVRPDIGYQDRYDKMHRVIFGEYVPLKDMFPFLESLTPYGAGFGIQAGQKPYMFEYAGHRFTPLICFEDTVPQLVRRLAQQTDSEGRTPDVLLNLTNDAWFHGSSELDQHLITAAFRCVETRTPMVRSVNGGISAFIDGNGQIREPDSIYAMQLSDDSELDPEFEELQGMRDPGTGRWRRQFTGVVFGELPTDPRQSSYVKFGDWFAIACSIAAMLGIMAGFRKQSAVVPD